LDFPDVETSSAEYARRFAGRVGEWFLDVQTRATLELLEPFRGGSVLDVGGGHAQLAGPLAAAGFDVTVLGSQAVCAERLRPLLDAGKARFQAGDLLRAPFADKSFDVAMSFRLLPHLEVWRALVAELARLARRAVIVDYPTTRSLNAFADAFFGAKKRVEGNTRPFLVFGDADVADAFRSSGWSVTGARRQFFFPMAMHRAFSSRPLSSALERVAGALGLRRAMGSPVVLRAEPRA